MEELIGFIAGNLEAHNAEALSRDNWFLAFAAVNKGFRLHGSLPEICLVFHAAVCE
jgi:hypothetical protein